MIKPEYRVSQAEEKIRTLLAKSHHVSPTDKQAFGSENVEYEFNQMNNVFKGINILTWFVGIMTLIAGVIGVSNIMLVIIKERTKEIGIQRAIGATPANIMSQIVLESVFLTFIAGFIGMIFGIAIIEILNIATSSASSDSIVFLNPEVNLRSVISAIFLLIIAGAIAGSLPARRALRIKPIEAIRTEL